MDCKYVVYAHRKPNAELFYIGIGSGYRPYDFRKRSEFWLRVVQKYGKPQVQILHESLTWEDACAIEVELIKKYGRIGMDECGVLVNRSKGGDGVLGVEPWNKNTSMPRWIVEKASLSRTGVPRPQEYKDHMSRICTIANPMKGKKHTEKQKQIWSEQRRGEHNPSFGSVCKWRGVFGEMHPRFGLSGDKHARSKRVRQLTKDGIFLKEYESISIAAKNGFTQSSISQCCQGKLKSHKGFIWEYAK